MRPLSNVHRYPFLLATMLLVGVPPAHAAPTSLPGYVILPLSRMANTNHTCIRVNIDGQSTMLVLDTGAPATVLDTAFYRGVRKKAGSVGQDKLPPEVARKTSANGQSAEIGVVNSLKAGPLELGKRQVIVTDLSDTIGNYNSQHHAGAYAGLLGQDVLHQYNALIDWRRRGVYFNTDPSKRMNPGRAFVGAGWTAIPMSATNGRHFSVACEVDGKPVRLIVDTGAQFTTFNKDTIPLNIIYNRDTGSSMARLASMEGMAGMIGSTSSLYPARVDCLKIGSYEIRHLNVAVHKLPGGFLEEKSAGEGPMLGLLGAEILAANNAVIDIAGSTLYLKPDAKR